MAGDVAEIVVDICVFCISSFLSTYTPNAALKVGNVGGTS